MTFADVVFGNNLDTIHGINGVKIPGPKVINIAEPIKFEAPQTFQNSTHIRSLKVSNSLNGISVLTATGMHFFKVIRILCASAY